MSDKSKEKLMAVFLSGLGILFIDGVIYHLSLPVNKAKASIALKHKYDAILELGLVGYAENHASYHGVTLKRQSNWRRRDADGYLAASMHDDTWQPWHSDSYLFLMTKHGIEAMIGKSEPDNMPSYEDKFTDEETLAALS